MNYFWLLTGIAIICCGSIVYYNWQSNQAKIAQSKAIIAQAQPSIILARGQSAVLIINAISDKLLIFGLFITLVIVIIILLIELGKRGNYEKRLSEYRNDCTTDNSQ